MDCADAPEESSAQSAAIILYKWMSPKKWPASFSPRQQIQAKGVSLSKSSRTCSE